VASFEDLCRLLFDAVEERFLILQEDLFVNAFSLDRRYVLSCAMADEEEGSWEGTVEIAIGADAANSAASMFEDVYDESGAPMGATWEVEVRWHGPAITDSGVIATAGPDIAHAAGLKPSDVTGHTSAEWAGSDWIHHPTFEYAIWLAEDEDPDEDAARIVAIAEDGLARLEELGRHWPVVPREEAEEPGGLAEAGEAE
jgi:hypothetical protein